MPQNHLLILVVKTLNSLIKCQAKHKKKKERKKKKITFQSEMTQGNNKND